MKLIEKYVQKNEFNRFNKVTDQDIEMLNLEKDKLDDGLMQKFIKNFTLDQTDELYDFEIYQLLDKEKFQAKLEIEVYFQKVKLAS